LILLHCKHDTKTQHSAESRRKMNHQNTAKPPSRLAHSTNIHLAMQLMYRFTKGSSMIGTSITYHFNVHCSVLLVGEVVHDLRPCARENNMSTRKCQKLICKCCIRSCEERVRAACWQANANLLYHSHEPTKAHGAFASATS
jgi:hypothetical protein